MLDGDGRQELDVRVSSTATALAVCCASKTLMKALDPSGLTAMRSGAPDVTGILPDTWSVTVSTTVRKPASPCAT